MSRVAPCGFFSCLALAAILAFAAPARAEIFRCTSAAGSVTYQEIACAEGERLRRVDVPASYPEVDSAERERLFRREAELDRRLEARRERESREAIARISRPPAVEAQPPDPQVVLFVPTFPRSPRHSHAHARFRPPFLRGS
jgi:hypothetical protein